MRRSGCVSRARASIRRWGGSAFMAWCRIPTTALPLLICLCCPAVRQHACDSCARPCLRSCHRGHRPSAEFLKLSPRPEAEQSFPESTEALAQGMISAVKTGRAAMSSEGIRGEQYVRNQLDIRKPLAHAGISIHRIHQPSPSNRHAGFAPLASIRKFLNLSALDSL